MSDAYIYDAIRTPRGKGRADGSLHEVTALRLSADTLNAIKARNGTAADEVEDVIWGNVTQVGEQGGLPRPLGGAAFRPSGKRARPLDQPLLRQRARGGEPRGEPGQGHRRRLHRRRRRDDEPGADGLGRRGDRRRSLARDEDLLRAAGHQRRHHRHRVRLLPRRLRRARRREPEARGEGLGRGPLREVGRAGQGRQRPADPRARRAPAAADRHAVARRAQAVVQGHRRDHARLRRGGDPQVPASRADQPRPPRRQLVAASSMARRRC